MYGVRRLGLSGADISNPSPKSLVTSSFGRSLRRAIFQCRRSVSFREAFSFSCPVQGPYKSSAFRVDASPQGHALRTSADAGGDGRESRDYPNGKGSCTCPFPGTRPPLACRPPVLSRTPPPEGRAESALRSRPGPGPDDGRPVGTTCREERGPEVDGNGLGRAERPNTGRIRV